MANPTYFTKPTGNVLSKYCQLAYIEVIESAQLSPSICYYYLEYSRKKNVAFVPKLRLIQKTMKFVIIRQSIH